MNSNQAPDWRTARVLRDAPHGDIDRRWPAVDAPGGCWTPSASHKRRRVGWTAGPPRLRRCSRRKGNAVIDPPPPPVAAPRRVEACASTGPAPTAPLLAQIAPNATDILAHFSLKISSLSLELVLPPGFSTRSGDSDDP